MKILLGASLLAASAALMAGCHSSETAKPAAAESMPAHVVESRQADLPVNVRATGTIQAKEAATISAQVMGRIEQVLVREGETVRAGQTLVALDGAALNSSLAQAKAGVIAAKNAEAAAQSNASLAASTLARYKQLEAEKSVSPQEMDEVSRRAQAAQAQFDAARAQADAAQAQAAGARTMVGYTRLVAPFAGIVTARMVDPGTMAAPGVPMLQVDRAGVLQLNATVDESAIGSVRLGTKTQIAAGGVTQPWTGTIAEIVPAADPASHSFMVKIDLPSSNQLRAGMFGTAEFANGTRTAILVPRSAIVERGALQSAYVLDDRGIAQLRYVTLGATHGDAVEVLSGIAPQERLVDAPEDRDFAGKHIEVQP